MYPSSCMQQTKFHKTCIDKMMQMVIHIPLNEQAVTKYESYVTNNLCNKILWKTTTAWNSIVE